MLVVPGTPVICSGMVTKILSPGGVKFLVSRLFFTNTGILWQPRFFAPLFSPVIKKLPFAFEANGSFFQMHALAYILSPSAAYRRASGSSLFPEYPPPGTRWSTALRQYWPRSVTRFWSLWPDRQYRLQTS